MADGTRLKKDRLIDYFGMTLFDISQTGEWPVKRPPPFAEDVPGEISAKP